MKILSQMNLSDEERKGHKGMFTSGFASITGDKRIALFLNGHNHAGENIAQIPAKRSDKLDPPIQMCDGLVEKFPKILGTYWATALLLAEEDLWK